MPSLPVASTPRSEIVLPGVYPPQDGHAIRVVAAGVPVAVFNRGGALFAIDAVCTHMGGPLEHGKVSDHQVECPLHGSEFDLVTGQVRAGPARTPVRAYRVRFESGALILTPA